MTEVITEPSTELVSDKKENAAILESIRKTIVDTHRQRDAGPDKQ